MSVQSFPSRDEELLEASSSVSMIIVTSLDGIFVVSTVAVVMVSIVFAMVVGAAVGVVVGVRKGVGLGLDSRVDNLIGWESDSKFSSLPSGMVNGTASESTASDISVELSITFELRLVVEVDVIMVTASSLLAPGEDGARDMMIGIFRHVQFYFLNILALSIFLLFVFVVFGEGYNNFCLLTFNSPMMFSLICYCFKKYKIEFFR